MDPVVLAALGSFTALVVSWLALPNSVAMVETEARATDVVETATPSVGAQA